MRKLVLILTLLSVLHTYADHLIGSELTYKHLYGQTYQVDVTLYRDCDDCKLGGQGGGTSSASCSDLTQLFIRTTSAACGNKNIGSINLSKQGFEDVTEICPTANSKCQANSNYTYGIEAHRYRGTINFSSYNAYSGCDLQLFFFKSERSSSIATLNFESADLYNYAMINPWGGAVNSPKFNTKPQIIFESNKTVTLNDGAAPGENDSLVYKLVAPLKAYNQSINYTGTFNPQYFLTAYCPSGIICAPNPTAPIPEGIYLNTESGDIIFTPTNSGEVGTRVLEVEQWQKRNGSMTKVGVIRRDLVTITTSSSGNNNPVITADYEYQACVGQWLNFTITANDDLSVGTSIADSVSFQVFKTLDSLSAVITNTSAAPFQEVVCAFRPRVEHIGTHFIHFKATDNNCPQPGTGNKVIKIIVHPQPIIDFFVEDKFCGNNEITLTSDAVGTFNLDIFDHGSLIHSNEVLNRDIITNFDSTKLNYELSFTSEHGCLATRSKEYINGGASAISNLVLSGEKAYCPGDTANLSANHLQASIHQIVWNLQNQVVDTDSLLDIILSSQNLSKGKNDFEVNYTLKQNDYLCERDEVIHLDLKPSPIVNFTPAESYCHSVGEIVLQDLNATPGTGTWSSDVTIGLDRIDFSQFANEDTTFFLNYILADPLTACNGYERKPIVILKAPELELMSRVICGTGNAYNLNNLIKLPFHYSPENITWECVESSIAIVDSHPIAKLDVPSLGEGVYTIRGKNTYTNGCEVSSEAWVKVDQGLTLTTNDKKTICQSDEAVNLDNFFAINAPGGAWLNLNVAFGLNGNMFTPNVCGNYKFKYVYDINGCFDEIEVDLRVICKPLIEVSIPDTLCENSESIVLPTNNIGYWQGGGVVDKEFFPENLDGIQDLLYTTNAIEGCVYDSIFQLMILPALEVKLSSLDSSICEGEEVNFKIVKPPHATHSVAGCGNDSVHGEYEMSYVPGDCDIASKHARFNITYNTHLNCPSGSADFNVPINPKPVVDISPIGDVCWPYNLAAEAKVTVGKSPRVRFDMVGDDASYTFNSLNFYNDNIEVDNYTLTISSSDENKCKNTQVIEDFLTVSPKPEASFIMNKKDKISLSERELYIANTSTIESGEMTHAWYLEKRNIATLFSEEENPVFELPPDTGLHNFILVSKSDKECLDTASESIIVVPDIVAFIPNAFTPDKKGPEQNGTFTIISKNAQNFHIKIFNQWGQLVFETYDINHSWDGTFMGKDCQIGVYAYVIELVNKSGVTYNFEGAVNLLR